MTTGQGYLCASAKCSTSKLWIRTSRSLHEQFLLQLPWALSCPGPRGLSQGAGYRALASQVRCVPSSQTMTPTQDHHSPGKPCAHALHDSHAIKAKISRDAPTCPAVLRARHSETKSLLSFARTASSAHSAKGPGEVLCEHSPRGLGTRSFAALSWNVLKLRWPAIPQRQELHGGQEVDRNGRLLGFHRIILLDGGMRSWMFRKSSSVDQVRITHRVRSEQVSLLLGSSTCDS